MNGPLPLPCARCGHQYSRDLLKQAVQGLIQLDPQPTHLCTNPTVRLFPDGVTFRGPLT